MNRDKFTPEQLKQIDKAREYWETRLEDFIHSLEDSHEDRLVKLLSKEYKRSIAKIERFIEDIYFKMLETGEISTTKLYQYGRMKALATNINKELKRLGEVEVEIMKKELEFAYRDALGELPKEFGLADFAIPNKKAIEKLVMTPWAGRDFSSSIWQNKNKMLQVLQKELLNCVSLGYSKDKAIKQIMSKTGAGFNDAERLVRTELMHVLNDSNDMVAKESGYKYKMWLTAKDERVCDACRLLEEDVFPIDAQVYSHPRCRCTFIYLKNYSEKSVLNNSESDIIKKRKEREDQIRDEIKDGVYPKKLNKGAQEKHIKGTSRYIEGRSYLTISLEEAQELVNNYAGTGELVFNRKGEWRNQEIILTDNVIGYNASDLDDNVVETCNFKIHYSKNGTHIVPK